MPSVIPDIEAVAVGCHHGAARPANAGTHSTPALSEAATASISWAPAMTPSEDSQRIADAAV